VYNVDKNLKMFYFEALGGCRDRFVPAILWALLIKYKIKNIKEI